MKSTVRQFVEGNSGCVVFFGPSGSGKSYAMQGKTGTHRGVIPRAIEEVLTLIGMDTLDVDYDGGFFKPTNSEYESPDRIYLRAAMYMVHCENAYDLLTRGSA
jgi:hypothetical protein